MGKRTLMKTAIACLFLATAATAENSFIEDFNELDTNKWRVSTWQAPGNIADNTGVFSKDNVSIIVSGSVTGAFVYADKAITEIDVEFESTNKDTVHLISWIGEKYKNEHSPITSENYAPYNSFNVYKFEWSKDNIVFYINGDKVATHRNKVPKNKGKMIFNHWGSNFKYWGGPATLNTPRYVFIDYFKFTQPNG